MNATKSGPATVKMKPHVRGEPLNAVLGKRVVLWRSCTHTATETRPNDVVFEETDRSFVGRLQLSGTTDVICEPIVTGNKVARDRNDSVPTLGFVLFLAELPPEDWTHLLVQRVSKPMTQAWNPQTPMTRLKGMAAFADVAEPLDMGEYLAFRRRMCARLLGKMNASAAEKFAIAMSDQPKGARRSEHRLVVHHRWCENVAFDYHHFAGGS